MLVVHPDGEHEWKEVDLVIDNANACIGVQLVGDGPLRGTLILVPEAAIENTRLHGDQSDKLIIQE
jgi:hypothetical protein